MTGQPSHTHRFRVWLPPELVLGNPLERLSRSCSFVNSIPLQILQAIRMMFLLLLGSDQFIAIKFSCSCLPPTSLQHMQKA